MTPPPLSCYRCGQPGHAEWIDVASYANPEPVWYPGRQWCTTPGCTDPDGSRRLTPLSPEELRERADRDWIKRHTAIAEEYGRAMRELIAATEGW